MSVFVTTLLVTVVCCLLMGLGLLLGGKPLEGGCGKAPPGASRCAGCPNQGRHEPSECPNRGDHQ
jgi:hypothetical protein